MKKIGIEIRGNRADEVIPLLKKMREASIPFVWTSTGAFAPHTIPAVWGSRRTLRERSGEVDGRYTEVQFDLMIREDDIVMVQLMKRNLKRFTLTVCPEPFHRQREANRAITHAQTPVVWSFPKLIDVTDENNY